MFQLRRILLGILCVPATSAAVCADDFEILVTVKTAGKQVETRQTRFFPPPKTLSPVKKPQTRPVFKAKPGTDLRVLWSATNSHKSATVKNVLVHFFVVKEDKIGQQKVPDVPCRPTRRRP